MYDPGAKEFRPIPPDLAAKFAGPVENLTPTERVQRDWTRFEEGELIRIKGINFRLTEVGETRLVLRPL